MEEQVDPVNVSVGSENLEIPKSKNSFIQNYSIIIIPLVATVISGFVVPLISVLLGILVSGPNAGLGAVAYILYIMMALVIGISLVTGLFVWKLTKSLKKALLTPLLYMVFIVIGYTVSAFAVNTSLKNALMPSTNRIKDIKSKLLLTQHVKTTLTLNPPPSTPGYDQTLTIRSTIGFTAPESGTYRLDGKYTAIGGESNYFGCSTGFIEVSLIAGELIQKEISCNIPYYSWRVYDSTISLTLLLYGSLHDKTTNSLTHEQLGFIGIPLKDDAHSQNIINFQPDVQDKSTLQYTLSPLQIPHR